MMSRVSYMIRDGPLFFYWGVPILVSQHTILFNHSAASNIFFSFYSCEQFLTNKNYEFWHKKILFMLLLKIILWHFDNYMTHCQGEIISDYCIFLFCSFLSQRKTSSVLYIYRNSRLLYVHLLVLILN